MKRLATLALVVAITLCLLPLAAALAADGTTVSLSPWWDALRPYIVETLSAVVLAVLGWILMLFKAWLGIQIDNGHRDALHRAIMTGVAAALDRAGASAATATIDVKSQVVAEAIRWAESSVPDAIKRLGATPDKLAELAASKITILAEAPSSPAAAGK